MTMKIAHIPTVEVNVKENEQPELPTEVDVELDNGLKAMYPVEWKNNGAHNENPNEIHGKLRVTTYPKPFIEQRADPYLYKHTDGYYYFTGSYPLYDRIVLRRAKTIADRKSTRLNTSHVAISYAVFC